MVDDVGVEEGRGADVAGEAGASHSQYVSP